MFRQLRIKFVLIYSFSILFLVAIAFSMIYLNTYKHTVDTINEQLLFRGDIPDLKETNNKTCNRDNCVQDDIRSYPIYNNDIFLELDSALNILSIYSYLEPTQEEIDLIQEELKNPGTHLIEIGSQTYTYAHSSNYVKLVDITPSINMLNDLKLSLLSIGTVLVIISILFSYIFSTKILKPVAANYNKQVSFVSDASHEIKTPISVISSCLELIKDGDDESEKWIDYCINETRRLKSLTTNLLTLSTGDKSITTKNLASINISQKLDLLLCAYEVRLFEDDFKLDIAIEDNLYTKILEDDFTQMVHILLDNAIKYNDEHKYIQSSLKTEGKFIKLSIINTANPVSDTDIKQMFDRFYRQDIARNKKIQGFGLGLSLVLQIINNYNLKHHVAYIEDRLVFEIKFPISK